MVLSTYLFIFLFSPSPTIKKQKGEVALLRAADTLFLLLVLFFILLIPRFFKQQQQNRARVSLTCETWLQMALVTDIRTHKRRMRKRKKNISPVHFKTVGRLTSFSLNTRSIHGEIKKKVIFKCCLVQAIRGRSRGA